MTYDQWHQIYCVVKTWVKTLVEAKELMSRDLEALKESREALGSSSKEASYLEQMIEVVGKIGYFSVA